MSKITITDPKTGKVLFEAESPKVTYSFSQNKVDILAEDIDMTSGSEVNFTAKVLAVSPDFLDELEECEHNYLLYRGLTEEKEFCRKCGIEK